MKIVKVTPKSQEIDRICGREVAPSKEIQDEFDAVEHTRLSDMKL